MTGHVTLGTVERHLIHDHQVDAAGLLPEQLAGMHDSLHDDATRRPRRFFTRRRVAAEVDWASELWVTGERFAPVAVPRRH